MKPAFSTLGCPEWDLRTIAEKARLFESAGVEIACLSSYIRLIRGKEIYNEADAVLQLARDIGSPIVRVFTGTPPEGMETSQALGSVAEGLKILAPLAENYAVKLALETHDFLSTGELVREVIDAVPSQFVGVLWDIRHPWHSGEPPERTAELLFDRLVHTHFKDSNLALAGEGTLPITDFLHILSKNGYEGFISFEWEKLWHPEIPQPDVAFPHFINFLKGAGYYA